MAQWKRARRGRKRHHDVVREPNGQPSRAAQHRSLVVPPEALRRRSEANGLSAAEVLGSGAAAVTAICADQAAGTAIGRLMWRFASDGARIRRMADFGARDRDDRPVPEPVITDDMAMAADMYRKIWATWHHLTGLPRRHPQGQQFVRQDRAHESMVVECGRAKSEENVGGDKSCRCPVCRATERLRIADAALHGCRQHLLVCAVVEAVVIEDVAPESLVLGERSAALHALRRGLDAIHVALCTTKRRERAA